MFEKILLNVNANPERAFAFTFYNLHFKIMFKKMLLHVNANAERAFAFTFWIYKQKTSPQTMFSNKGWESFSIYNLQFALLNHVWKNTSLYE